MTTDTLLFTHTLAILGGVAELTVTEGPAKGGRSAGREATVKLHFTKTEYPPAHSLNAQRGESSDTRVEVLDNHRWAPQPVVGMDKVNACADADAQQALIASMCRAYIEDALGRHILACAERIAELEAQLERYL